MARLLNFNSIRFCWQPLLQGELLNVGSGVDGASIIRKLAGSSVGADTLMERRFAVRTNVM